MNTYQKWPSRCNRLKEKRLLHFYCKSPEEMHCTHSAITTTTFTLPTQLHKTVVRLWSFGNLIHHKGFRRSKFPVPSFESGTLLCSSKIRCWFIKLDQNQRNRLFATTHNDTQNTKPSDLSPQRMLSCSFLLTIVFRVFQTRINWLDIW